MTTWLRNLLARWLLPHTWIAGPTYSDANAQHCARCGIDRATVTHCKPDRTRR